MASSECTVVSETRCFQGSVIKYEHRSETLNCTMRFNAYLPDTRCTLPVLYFLSGLTCTEDNFMQKAGALRYLSDRRIILICPDTSPRGVDVEGQDAADDLGTGAGFYVDATEPQWKDHYRMYSYVTEELPALVGRHLPVDKTRVSIMGHSMGGHGALVCALRNPGKYRSVSGFAAICNPSECPWGQKAFTAYMGDHRKAWADYDATALVKRYTGPALPILLDQGDQDPFLKKGQLLPERFIRAVEDNPEKQNLHLDNHMRPGFDHSYYFIQTFIEEHIQFHARHLLA
ncbi:hypothetical protein IWQ60_005426 [Tieghemiomyces parasiticus]|uniref:S-formylglutathione hydrolase n=1 Tax=Tieghemiomyces parasiticus TaxID=78921 RepID=A0A9W8AEM8_9FUNG|nr:hypothetical protein IWQ60_005426 [Tieghemiomyces parasiticus]